MIIDVWGQHPTMQMLSNPIFDSLRRWTKQKIPNTEIPVQATLAQMEAANVDKMLISAWVGYNGTMISNREVADFVSQSNGRLIGIGSVDITDPVKAIAELRNCKNSYGFKGVRMLPWLWKLPPTDRLFYPIYAACVELDIPFCTQIGHTGPLMPSEVGRPIYLDQVCLDFPDLKIVAGHIGYPWTEEAIAVATKHPNFYIDTSAYTTKRYPAELVKFMRGHGSKKVMFGTNYPMISPRDCLANLGDLALSKDAQDQFLYKNAIEVFDL